MRFLLIPIFVIMLPITFYGQDNTEQDSVHYKSHIVQDYRIEKLNKTYTESYQLDGYRIQIYSGSKNQPAKQARLKFQRNFKDVSAYEKYDNPHFKVRVGDFKTKLEALKFQKEIVIHFPYCYIVNDKIEFKQ